MKLVGYQKLTLWININEERFSFVMEALTVSTLARSQVHYPEFESEKERQATPFIQETSHGANFSNNKKESPLLFKKVVRFAETNTTHHMYVWTFAYTQSRNGIEWIQSASDRERFLKRIQIMEKLLSPILNDMLNKYIF